MKHFRKVWTDSLNAWLRTTKGMRNDDAYALFLRTFPEIEDVTRTAFCNQRSRVGAAGKCHNPRFSRKPRPLYSEQVKKGYVRIKIAQPNVWVSKAKWVYMETHPWEDFSERSNYIFLNGDNRDFRPENIERVPLKIMGLFSYFGGHDGNEPELTRLRIAQAKLKYETLNAGERLGLTKNYGSGRRFAKDFTLSAREYNRRPGRKERNSELAKLRRRKLKEDDPVRYREWQDELNRKAKERRDRKKLCTKATTS